jgi:MurNAc alpha-1-phosphate uridylyltransferase
MSPPRTALVYAAGRGERMRPLTLTTPKPLLAVGGKPLIAWHLERLAAAGIDDVVINTAHLAAQFPARLGDGAGHGLRIRYSHEGDEPLETGGGLVHALPLLGAAPFVVVNGDIWTDFEFSRLPETPAGLAHVVLVPKPDERPAGEFERRIRALALAAGGHPSRDYTLAGIGVYHPKLVAGVAPGKSSIVPCLLRAIDAGALSVEVFRGEWRDIGTPERLADLERHLAVDGNGGARC